MKELLTQVLDKSSDLYDKSLYRYSSYERPSAGIGINIEEKYSALQSLIPNTVLIFSIPIALWMLGNRRHKDLQWEVFNRGQFVLWINSGNELD